MICNESYYGLTRNFKFTDLWEDADSFLEDYNDCGIPTTISDDSAKTLFYLLFARYGYSTSASPNREQFKYSLFSIIFQYGPTWEKRLEIQKDLREANLEELSGGATQVFSHGFNPATKVTSNEIIENVDDQNISRFKKGKLETYSLLWDMLKTDVTNEFLERFKKLFKLVVEPELPLWYETQVIEEGEDD